jgi:hypothetical protein
MEIDINVSMTPNAVDCKVYRTGPPGFIWMGEWAAGTYNFREAVSHEGSSYRCNKTTTTEEPSATASDWDLLASKGDAARMALSNDLGSVSGAVAIDAEDGFHQSLTASGDITALSFTNLDGNPVHVHVDNSGGHSITLTADYATASLPVTGIYSMYVYERDSSKFVTVNGTYSPI